MKRSAFPAEWNEHPDIPPAFALGVRATVPTPNHHFADNDGDTPHPARDRPEHTGGGGDDGDPTGGLLSGVLPGS